MRRSVTFWAWMISIGLHMLVLTAFAVAKFSQSPIQDYQRTAPVAQVSYVKELLQANPVIAKPKIKRTEKKQLVSRTSKMISKDKVLERLKPSVQETDDLAGASNFEDGIRLGVDNVLSRDTEFFGSRTDQRKICYVVDCSGSMRGMFGLVQKRLKDSVASLQPDQYFHIIFFGNDRLYEFGGGQLIRATQNTKSDAYDFIDSVKPCGRTNALTALERAIQFGGKQRQGPSIIYFLTDGFELTGEDAVRFSYKIANLLKRFSLATKINTVGFWPTKDDRKVLETIARQSGGEFVIVTDGGN